MLGRAAGLLVRRSLQSQNALRCSGVLHRGFADGAATESAGAGGASAPPQLQEEKFVEPPIRVYGAAGRYASALYSASSQAQTLEKTQQDLQDVQDLADENDDFANFLQDPTIPREKKIAALNTVSEDLQLDPTTARFMALLAESDRLPEFSKIVETFGDIMAAVRGEVKATVTTAEELDEEELVDVKEGLSKLLKPGEKLLLTQIVDPVIIGGFIVDIGDKHMDMSLLARVKKVQQLIMETAP
mmetsp:Transcript_15519/g.46872  ORF Transcript_15519/g.46872 Transcript_15519/m.46872 type:complete len:244 (-) Transcript_15519:181-912(-)